MDAPEFIGPKFIANGEAFVVVPLREYQALRRLAEEAEDAADEADARRLHDDHLAAKARGEWLSMPRAQWDRIRAGTSPVRVIREHRGLTQTRLAKESGVDQSQISAIENNRRTGTAVTLKAIAKALGAPLDALVADDRG